MTRERSTLSLPGVALVLACALVACLVAWRVGGGAEVAAARADVTRIARSERAAPARADEYDVAARLVELAKDARFEMSHADAVTAQRRWMTPPFLPLSGDAARFVATIARGSADDGRFDRREALVSSTPGAISFRVNVPRGARLTFAEGLLDGATEATTFAVSVRDGKGALHDVFRHVLEPSASSRWTEQSCDLAAFAGQEIELRLATSTAQAHVATAARSPVALWGNPTLLAQTTPRVPYDVLWVVVDALRPDVIASFHGVEDEAKRAALLPPLEALLPKLPGLMPELDALAKRGVRFMRTYSAGAWTRPGTLALLAGARSSELGIGTTSSTVGSAEAARFYSSDPPLLPLVLRRHDVATAAFVNGSAPAGVDLGFERVVVDRDHAAEAATRWLRENKDTRFFMYVHIDAFREPYAPRPSDLEKVPPPPDGPKDERARRYMAAAARADEAIGKLLRTLDETGLRDRTIVVVTSSHGATLSSAHVEARRHDATSNFEETTKIPLVIAAPGLLPSDAEVETRVRSIDVAPTVLDLLGVEAPAKTSGRSLVPLAGGRNEPEERVVVSEGRGSRAIMHGRWRMILRDEASSATGAEVALFDLTEDPGERRNVAARRPDLVAEMRARLDAALTNAPVVGGASASASASTTSPTLHLRFVGGPSSRRVSGAIHIGDPKTRPRSFDVRPIHLGRDAFREDGERVDIALRTSPSTPVGFDVVVDPPSTPVSWELWLDDKPWPEQAVFGGPFGLPAPMLHSGVANDGARLAAQSNVLPTIDPSRDIGLFVTRDRARSDWIDGSGAQRGSPDETARRLLEWGGYSDHPGTARVR